MPDAPGSSTPPTLREYLDQRFSYERAITDQRFELAEKALTMQAREYERRLEELNHAHTQAVSERLRVLPREIFEQFKHEYDLFRRTTETTLASITTRTLTWTAAVGLFVVLMSLAIRLWPALAGP